jgi:hypothetical protein
VSALEGLRSPWLKILLGFGLATLVAQYFPHRNGSAAPPVGQLLQVAALVTLFTTGALYFVLRQNLRLPTAVALLAVAYNALIVLVKFVLGPYGLYEVNESVDLTGFFNVTDAVGATWTALVVFALYLGGYFLVYWVARARLGRARDDDARQRIVVPFVAAAYALVGAAIALTVFVIVGGAIGAMDEYASFVVSSSVSVVVAVALAGAGALAALAFHGTAERAEVLGNAALVTSFFWIGLAFLALYHALWVVYILALTAAWPLRVVVPK